MVCVAPYFFASSSRDGTTSTAMILLGVSGLSFAAMIAARPTAPAPTTATLEVAVGLTTFNKAPAPVMMPQPKGARSSSGAFDGTLITLRSEETQCLDMLDWPKKCDVMGSPDVEEYALLPSSRPTPKLDRSQSLQKEVFCDLQFVHLPQEV
jgi:hypothetical protein